MQRSVNYSMMLRKLKRTSHRRRYVLARRVAAERRLQSRLCACRSLHGDRSCRHLAAGAQRGELSCDVEADASTPTRSPSSRPQPIDARGFEAQGRHQTSIANYHEASRSVQEEHPCPPADQRAQVRVDRGHARSAPARTAYSLLRSISFSPPPYFNSSINRK
jgi:hypothetical protein